MRSLPTGLEQPDHSLIGPDRRTTLSFTLELITPMFGGSATAGTVDPERPVTAKSVRGQLRFWWRACRAGAFKSTEALYQEETRIWGGAATYRSDGSVENGPGLVDVRVAEIRCGQAEDWGRYEANRTGRPTFRPEQWAKPAQYALFPFQGKTDKSGYRVEVSPAKCLRKLKFDLQLVLAAGAVKPEVLAAVWAWLTFGGIGARTRRGCGALRCTGQPEGLMLPATAEDIIRTAQMHVIQHSAPWGIPSLYQARLIVGKPSGNDAMVAWPCAVALMRDFRQGEHIGRRPGSDPSKPLKLGRSYWPEPDAIRLMDPSRRRHQPLPGAAKYYPRADLGLPIIFHFIDQDDPSDQTLQGAKEGARRMASPIVLKALLDSDGARPLVLLLSAPHIWDSSAPGAAFGAGLSLPSSQLAPSAAAAKAVKPMNDQGKDSARDAFMAFAAKQLGAKEVKL